MSDPSASITITKRLALADVPDERSRLMRVLRSHGPIIAGTMLHLGQFTDKRDADSYTRRTLDELSQSALWWVGSDMCDLLEASAPTMPAQPLMPDDPPDQRGFVVFERPLVGTDGITGERRPMASCMRWAPVRFLDGRGHALLIETFVHGQVPGMGTTVWPLGYATWMVGAEPGQANGPDGNTLEGREARDSSEEDCRRIAALWTLSAQETLASVAATESPKAAAKRAQREQLPSTVNVVRLRRASSHHADTDQPSDRNYSHRWIVSGHWRNQYLPSRDAHRLQWIAPHVKGPEDKPLVVKDTVKAWVR